VAGVFSFSIVADVPPPAPVGAAVEDDSVDSLLVASVGDAAVEVAAVEVVVVLVVLVEVAESAAFSADVLAGGIMSGVLLGIASETLLPPQAASIRAPVSAAPASSVRRPRTDDAHIGRTPARRLSIPRTACTGSVRPA
jgi:hypothetical protein